MNAYTEKIRVLALWLVVTFACLLAATSSGAQEPEPVLEAEPDLNAEAEIETGALTESEIEAEVNSEAEAAVKPAFQLPGELSAELQVEASAFLSPALYDGQEEVYASLALQPEYFVDWADGQQQFEAILFGRYDSHDKRRTHFDVRELSWLVAGDLWQFRAGVSKVYWGVTESRQLVDIINQVDAVEDLRLQERLGQPMINPALTTEYGTLSLFALPLFRERAFPGPKGRLRPLLLVSTDRARYESPDEDRHLDLAARYSHFLGPLDFGVSYFQGTAREPALLGGRDRNGAPILIPFYELIRRGSLDTQLILGGLALKFEGIYEEKENAPTENYFASVAGFEYTFVGIFGSLYDLGVIGEYLYDERLEDAPQPFDDDVFAGIRLVLNDAAGTEILAGAIVDRHRGTTLYQVEASRRLGDSWKLRLEMQLVEDAPPVDQAVFGLRNDDLARLTLSYFF
ncbi:MAG: hypothetical protein NXI24_22665 [bacterium]|nr:hypothetical protein [bacterium]